MTSVRYMYPNGAKVPTQAQMEKDFSKVHAVVSMSEDASTVDIVHNMIFEPDAPPEVLQVPVVQITAQSGGPALQYPVVTQKDENTVTISKQAGPGTQAVYDVWISRHAEAKPWKTGAAGEEVEG
jgi:hypothetical protein